MLKMKLYHDLFDRELPPFEILEHWAETDPSPERLHQLGVAYFQKLAFHLAEETFSRVITMRPSADVHFHRGVTRSIMGKFHEALADFEATLTFEATHFGAHYNRGRLLARLRRYDEALEALEQALTLDRAMAGQLGVARAMRQIRRLRDGDRHGLLGRLLDWVRR